MKSSTAILLVEGEADKLFFEHILRRIGVEASVRVSVPAEFAQGFNTKGAVFNAIPTLLQQMRDGHLVYFAVVVDSDLPENGGGQRQTLRRFTEIVGPYGFVQRRRVGEHGGYLFEHDDGLQPVGIWIMPDNQTDGAIEDFVKLTVADSQKVRFQNGSAALQQSIRPFLFKPTHYVKAEVATWLAWQQIPGQGIFACAKNDLVDLQSEPIIRLINWLRCSFA